jgi:hypothetical protein
MIHTNINHYDEIIYMHTHVPTCLHNNLLYCDRHIGFYMFFLLGELEHAQRAKTQLDAQYKDLMGKYWLYILLWWTLSNFKLCRRNFCLNFTKWVNDSNFVHGDINAKMIRLFFTLLQKCSSKKEKKNPFVWLLFWHVHILVMFYLFKTTNFTHISIRYNLVSLK